MKILSLLFTVVVSVVAFAQPAITSLSTYSANVGASVTITGSGFSTTAANNVVYFGSAKASITGTPTATSIVVTVPAGSTYAPVSVTVGGLTGESRRSFAVRNTSLGSPTQSTSQFAAALSYSSSASIYSTYSPATDKVIGVGDFNLDGKVDIVKAGNLCITAHKNTATSGVVDANSFATGQTFSTVVTTENSSPNSLQVADIDNDGKLDVITANTNHVSVFRNTSTVGGAIDFSLTNLPLSGVYVRLADIDGDGKKDFLLANSYFSAVSIYRNTSSPGTISYNSTPSTVSGGSGNRHFEVGYINTDNLPDILLPTEDQNTTLIIALNQSSPGIVSFVTPSVIGNGYYGAYNILIADLDSDSDNDMYTSKRFVKNESSTALSVSTEESTFLNGGLYWFAAGDYTGDGKVDMIASYRNSGTKVYPIQNNYSSGNFEGNFSTIMLSSGKGDPLICDIDGDNKLDFIISGHETASFQIIKNNLAPPPISASPSSLSGFVTCAGTESSEQFTSISGTSLGTTPITITPPAGCQISLTTGTGFSSNAISLTPDGSGNVASTTIYVRLSSTAAAGNYSSNITAVSGSNSASIAVSGTVNSTTITTQPTTTAIVRCNNETATSLTVATSASSPSYLWQQSTNGTTGWSDATTATGYQTATMTPSHAEINWGVRYYRCVVTSAGCSTTSNTSASYSIANLTQSVQPSTTAQNVCIGGTATALTVSADAMGKPITYIWQSATTANGSMGTAVGNTGTNTFTPPSSTAGTLYYRCYYQFCGGYSNASQVSGAITVTDTYTWTGATSTNPTVAGNWNPAAVPCSGANEVIPTGLTNYPSYTNLTIDAGTTLTVQSGAKMDISGVLTNNGTLTIESGATLVQGASSTLAGSGTYNVKQNITGAGSTTPSGRFWYLGSPVSLSSSSVYFGNAANVVKKRDEATNAWITVASGTPENLVVGKGYYTQAMANSTINFTGGVLNNGAITINGLTRTSGQGFEGFNLVSNPYPSYLNWDDVTKTNVDGTMWYRTNDGSNMVFDTYVAGSGGIGTNLGGTSVTKFIPPMQSFWVRVSQGQTSGSLTLGNAMRSHFSSLGGSVAGLKSTNDEPSLFLRMNLLQAGKKDQLIVYVNETATNGFDALDGEKMMQAGYPQFYTKAGDKKIVINGLNSAKKQQALPITLELPTTGVHSFIIEDLEISNGLVWLEDKQEEIIQALEPGTVYEFYAASGLNAERFVLHFQLIDDAVPTNVYNEVNSSANFSGKGASVHAEAAGVVVIKLPASTEGVTDIQIRDAAGRVVYTGSTNTLETSVQLEQANGIYYVTLNSNAGVEVRKVFIQQ